MKKTAFTQAALIVLFTVCFLSTTKNLIEKVSIKSSFTTDSALNNKKNKTIIYDSAKGLKTDKLIKNLKQLDVFDKNGRKVLSINKFGSTIFLNSLKTGSYSIKVESKKGEIEYMKLIKR
ncbi:hypothetical protein [Winogradskyella sp. UBA3174]|uniref:hypothetical protein n=1 Tax=Winogradskyella sp. UBA3174 TaxID=1947785 RepID=UPI0025CEE92D|nr:hypothetical protein [Winogradskyella sp. UBA3174]|tara:strand:- start:20632 stop:20991 length:360 start_codon:yes stop_codon:yes gene_type:complete